MRGSGCVRVTGGLCKEGDRRVDFPQPFWRFLKTLPGNVAAEQQVEEDLIVSWVLPLVAVISDCVAEGPRSWGLTKVP